MIDFDEGDKGSLSPEEELSFLKQRFHTICAERDVLIQQNAQQRVALKAADFGYNRTNEIINDWKALPLWKRVLSAIKGKL
jgi:hypothetical protein